MSLNPNEVMSVLRNCLFIEAEYEFVDDVAIKPLVPAIEVEGVLQNFVLHEGRYRIYEPTVKRMIGELNPMLFDDAGASFMLMLLDKNNEDWGGLEHCEVLLVLALAGGHARYVIDRNLWHELDHGLPLVQFFEPSTHELTPEVLQ